jgi:hypothetical protein
VGCEVGRACLATLAFRAICCNKSSCLFASIFPCYLAARHLQIIAILLLFRPFGEVNDWIMALYIYAAAAAKSNARPPVPFLINPFHGRSKQAKAPMHTHSAAATRLRMNALCMKERAANISRSLLNIRKGSGEGGGGG